MRASDMEVSTMRNRSWVLLCTAMLGLGAARADTLIIEGINAAKTTAANRPSRGMTMSTVSAKWGEPATRLAAVGQPPITRWEYNDFVVYFEHEHVIDAVVRRR
jgi:hypothetical protein